MVLFISWCCWDTFRSQAHTTCAQQELFLSSVCIRGNWFARPNLNCRSKCLQLCIRFFRRKECFLIPVLLHISQLQFVLFSPCLRPSKCCNAQGFKGLFILGHWCLLWKALYVQFVLPGTLTRAAWGICREKREAVSLHVSSKDVLYKDRSLKLS